MARQDLIEIIVVGIIQKTQQKHIISILANRKIVMISQMFNSLQVIDRFSLIRCQKV